ncbi:DUF6290 family protein [Brachyspira hyodysenteriae]|uniref:DUF6290 family protein n=1 Tax=Brachyspira hyodysenteriae TaxID=159 RepID=UPI0022CD4080|nr:DUF6290 family protein [Brachyspira hyodysenteriae]MCZ9920423.1 DUF6290 family protein [Brachyspira hyodysenteriae]MDA0024050.1 DUF6290 family protein [Brachyspira hyodysenteriae]MDA0063416.1 DUF6290 family protein [Brachyspira hyodysenteriae]MDA0095878.1 DUF6290 family protein [Brachyspira hyodysenteriae]
MDNKKNSWGGARANTGGAREGAGRKRIIEDRLDIKLYMRVSEKEQLLIKEKAEQNNVSVSQYIRDAVLKELNV